MGCLWDAVTQQGSMEVVWQCMCELSASAAARVGQNVRDQCSCDCCAEDGAMHCATFAIDDMCVVAPTCAVCVRCDMLEYARARMSCIRVFYLSRVAGEYLLSTKISKHAQKSRLASSLELCVGRATAAKERDSMKFG